MNDEFSESAEMRRLLDFVEKNEAHYGRIQSFDPRNGRYALVEEIVKNGEDEYAISTWVTDCLLCREQIRIGAIVDIYPVGPNKDTDGIARQYAVALMNCTLQQIDGKSVNITPIFEGLYKKATQGQIKASKKQNW
jgi:hypothetical protein